MKLIRLFVLLFCTTILVFISVWIYPTSVQSQVTIVSQSPSKYPRKSPPPNKTKAGGGLDPEKLCGEKTQKQLTALVPKDNPVLTTSEYPTFLFYVPYKSKDIVGEFSVLTWPGETTRISKTRSFKLPDTPGIISISLSSSDKPLEDNEYYHWYFKLYCKNNANSKVHLNLNGFVQKVTLTPERERQIATGSADIWYDSLAQLAEKLRGVSQPEVSLKKKWADLFKTIDAENLAQEKLLKPVSFID